MIKNAFGYSVLCTLLIAGPHFVTSAAEEKTAERGIARRDAALVTATASVEAIDYTTREVTLKGPLGNSVTFVVDPRIKRLNEIKVGDLVQADYYISVVAELRKPTAEEAKHPLVAEAVAGKASANTDPGAAVARRFKVVTTIEGLDRAEQTVTVKGPRGRTLTAKVEDPTRFAKLHLGDNVVITYTEALAISLDKLEKKHID